MTAPLLDPAHGPLIAVRMNILTRKTLGGLETDLQGRVLRPGGDRFSAILNMSKDTVSAAQPFDPAKVIPAHQ